MVDINPYEILSSDDSINTSNDIELEDQSETSSDDKIEIDSRDNSYLIEPSKISGSLLEESRISCVDEDDRPLRKSSEKKVLVDNIDYNKKSNLI